MFTFCPTCSNLLLGEGACCFALLGKAQPCSVSSIGARTLAPPAAGRRRPLRALAPLPQRHPNKHPQRQQTVEQQPMLRFWCQTCPYVYRIESKARAVARSVLLVVVFLL